MFPLPQEGAGGYFSSYCNLWSRTRVRKSFVYWAGGSCVWISGPWDLGRVQREQSSARTSGATPETLRHRSTSYVFHRFFTYTRQGRRIKYSALRRELQVQGSSAAVTRSPPLRICRAMLETRVRHFNA